MTKEASLVEKNFGEELNDSMPIDELEESLREATNSTTSSEETTGETVNSQNRDVPQVPFKNPATGNLVVDQSLQTVFS